MPFTDIYDVTDVVKTSFSDCVPSKLLGDYNAVSTCVSSGIIINLNNSGTPRGRKNDKDTSIHRVNHNAVKN